ELDEVGAVTAQVELEVVLVPVARGLGPAFGKAHVAEDQPTIRDRDRGGPGLSDGEGAWLCGLDLLVDLELHDPATELDLEVVGHRSASVVDLDLVRPVLLPGDGRAVVHPRLHELEVVPGDAELHLSGGPDLPDAVTELAVGATDLGRGAGEGLLDRCCVGEAGVGAGDRW